jgi:hypothetical protein
MLTTSLPTNVGAPGLAMGPPEGALMCIEPLTRDERNLVPELATSWDMDPLPSHYPASQKGCQVHDSTNFDAAACKWNFDQRRNQAK